MSLELDSEIDYSLKKARFNLSFEITFSLFLMRILKHFSKGSCIWKGSTKEWYKDPLLCCEDKHMIALFEMVSIKNRCLVERNLISLNFRVTYQSLMTKINYSLPTLLQPQSIPPPLSSLNVILKPNNKSSIISKVTNKAFF